MVHVRKLHFPPSSWVQSQVLLAERRVIPCFTVIHSCYQNYTHELGCQAGETHRWLVECRWFTRLVGSVVRFHTIYIGRKHPDRYMCVLGVRFRRNSLHRPYHLWPEIWKTMGNAKLREKQKWSNEKLHLDNARKLRGIKIDPEDKEFRGTIKECL